MAMTARQVYEGVLTEMNKVQAPSMLLEDFNYFINKAVNQYINKKYNVYDVNQQSTDDLRVLKATMVLPVHKTEKYGNTESGKVTGATSLYGATYEAYLPQDYLHMLNCICNYRVNKQFKCYDPNTYVQFGATRLTADLWGQIINNFYMKPSYKKPYYYLHNVNINTEVPTNPYNQSTGTYQTVGGVTYQLVQVNANSTVPASTIFYTISNNTATPVAPGSTFASGTQYYVAVLNPIGYGTDMPDQAYNVSTSVGTTSVDSTHVVGEGGSSSQVFNLPRTVQLAGPNNNKASLVEKPAGQRLANASKVRVEIRTGKDDSIFSLESIYIDYIKAPQYIRLTQEQIDLTEDTSQMMEFPDYVCQEIINELTHLIMENSSDPRLQSHMPVTMSIANPAQGQAQEQSK